jgi:predicted metal-dependent phosphoesterase TrpH
MISACFHIHTKYSPDSPTEPGDIVKFAKKLNLDVLGITDHNSPKGALETRKLAKKDGILVLIGQEVKTEYGDLLVFGSSENLRTDLFGLLDKAKSESLLTILPHPFDIMRKRSAIGLNLSKRKLELASKKIDAVEVFNSRCFLNVYNKEAEDFADQHKLPGIAGCDAHLLEELGSARNTINCDKSEEDVYKAIRGGKIVWSGKRTPVFSYVKRYVSKF